MYVTTSSGQFHWPTPYSILKFKSKQKNHMKLLSKLHVQNHKWWSILLSKATYHTWITHPSEEGVASSWKTHMRYAWNAWNLWNKLYTHEMFRPQRQRQRQRQRHTWDTHERHETGETNYTRTKCTGHKQAATLVLDSKHIKWGSDMQWTGGKYMVETVSGEHLQICRE